MGTHQVAFGEDLMRLEATNPALFNYLSGVTTTVAISIATSANGSNGLEWHSWIKAATWGFAAVFSAIVATSLDDARHEADLRITPHLKREERSEIYREEFDPVRFRSRACLVIAIALIFLGLLLQLTTF